MARAGSGVRITSNKTQWVAGGASLVPRMNRKAKAGLKAAMEAALEDARSNVHVQTGRLQASGRLEEISDEQIDLVFGGEEYGVDYAAYEELLHPYLEPAVMDNLGQAPDVGGPL